VVFHHSRDAGGVGTGVLFSAGNHVAANDRDVNARDNDTYHYAINDTHNNHRASHYDPSYNNA
jgi:hypothetical protein